MSKLANLLFILFSTFTGAVTGLLLSRFFIPKDVGLAGGAMVLFYGALGLIIGFVLSLVLKNRIPKSLRNVLIIIMAIASVAFVIWFLQRINEQKADTATTSIPKEPTITAPTVEVEKYPFGIGIAQVPIMEGKIMPIYKEFPQSTEQEKYGDLTFEKQGSEIVLKDYPNWLKPKVLKLDYQLFHFRAIKQQRNFVQIVVNEESEALAWVTDADVNFLSWEDFLPQVNSVESLLPQDYPVRSEPANHAEPLLETNHQDHLLQVLEVQGEWLKVKVMDQGYKEILTGWIRWRNRERLLIRYNMLS